MEIKVYRHIYNKDIFLARNWQYCGGNEETEFYRATNSVLEAVDHASKKGFMDWTQSFLGKDGKTKLKAKIKDVKDVDIDGYKGTLVKELVYPVKEFELVVMKEV